MPHVGGRGRGTPWRGGAAVYAYQQEPQPAHSGGQGHWVFLPDTPSAQPEFYYNTATPSGKRGRAVAGATVGPVNSPQGNHFEGVIIKSIKINGHSCKALIDTGCSRTLISPSIQINPEKFYAQSQGSIWSFDGQKVPHVGEAQVVVDVAAGQSRSGTSVVLKCSLGWTPS